VLFEDRFADARKGWGVSGRDAAPGATWVDAEGYHVHIKDVGGRAHWFISSEAIGRWRNVAVEAEVRLVEGRDAWSYGISVRTTREPRISSYLLVVNGRQQFALFKENDRGLIRCSKTRPADTWESSLADRSWRRIR
jgi:hypothetical protein